MKIDVNRNEDIQFWADRFGVSRAQLIAAIAATGPRVEDVEARIRRERSVPSKRVPANRKIGFHAYD